MTNIRDIELVSLHIPKTAGTSFQHSLIEEYGEKYVCRINIKPDESIVKVDGQVTTKFQIPFMAKVIHGHFTPKNLYHNFPKLNSLPIITWVRNPIDRVLSNYFYLRKQILDLTQNNAELISLAERMTKTLDEFISDENNQNRIYKFIEGLRLGDFKFVGIVEDYDNELIYAAKLFKWKKIKSFNDNETNVKMGTIDSRIIQKIQELNFKDMNLYELALKMKINRAKL